MRMAAIYARVSSEQQRETHTIASQTAALIDWAKTLDFEVPKAWIFEDAGYSGATLQRPGLERVRDLAAEGQIQTVLVYSPDRLSRKYAYQILLIEELARHGVETCFLNAPQAATAEDQLLVQFQGMIAEYERAQILERSRRGKRHRARAGEISVLSGAPYGYRYIRKRDDAPASYAVIDAEARVVRQVYAHYTTAGWSIGAIARWLNDQRVATRKMGARWERSMVWAMLRNPAYHGSACFGKTRVATRQRVTRPLRMRGGTATRDSAHHERPRDEWIAIPVPAIIDEPIFARAQELLHENKGRAQRRTIAPSLVQGLVSCRRCGYALSRTSTRSSARLIHYYRCLGSDGWRHLSGPRCTSRPVRQELLDATVWAEVMRLLEDPTLIQQELERRLVVARAADPTTQRERTVHRDLVRVGKSIERMLTAYQEDLLTLEQLRERMPPLRQREQALRTELHSITEQTRERALYLSLAETLSMFLARLRAAADTLDILERQRIVRLVVKEVLVADDTIIIRHCIPVPSGPPNGNNPASDPSHGLVENRSYLLRTGRHAPALDRPDLTPHPLTILQHAGPQPLLDETYDARVRHPVLDEADEPFVVQRIEEPLNVRVEHPVHLLRLDADRERVQRVVRAALWPKSVRKAEKVLFVNGIEHLDDGTLDDFVFQRRNAERPLPPVGLRDVRPTNWSRSERAPLDAGGEVLKIRFKPLAVVPPRFPIDTGSGVPLQREIRRPQARDVVGVVQQRGEPLFPVFPCCLMYPLDAIRGVNPALCPVLVTVERVPLGQPASLRRLRRRSPGLVRRLHRYYRAVRLPAVVHHRRESSDFSMRPATLVAAGNHGISRFPDAVRPHVHGVSDRAGFRCALRWRRVGCGLPPTSMASAPRCGHGFRGSIPGPRVPLSTLHRQGYPCRRMTWGRCGSLLLQRLELSSIAPRRFNRRTEVPCIPVTVSPSGVTSVLSCSP
jgi:site-specific DNA recombinase